MAAAVASSSYADNQIGNRLGFRRFNAADWCRRENLFKREVVMPLGLGDTQLRQGGSDFSVKGGRATLKATTSEGKHIVRNYIMDGGLNLKDSDSGQYKVTFRYGRAVLTFV